jgi:hypothetical protein
LSEIEEIIKDWLGYENLTPKEISLAKAIEQYVIKARIEELENVPTDYGEWITERINERIAELKKGSVTPNKGRHREDSGDY